MDTTINSYISELDDNLSDLPAEDRKDVVEFYREFLLDADFHDEEAINKELGTAKQLSLKILADYSLSATPAVKSNRSTKEQMTAESRDNFRMILWIMTGMLAAPIGIPAAIAVIGLTLALIAGLIASIIFLVGLLITVTLVTIQLVFNVIPLLSTPDWSVGMFYTGVSFIALGIIQLFGDFGFRITHFSSVKCVQAFRYLGNKFFPKHYYQKKSKSKEK